MRRPAVPALAVLAVLAAALLVAGCGGGSSSTTPAGGAEGTAPKKATAPNAPAGSKVVACPEGRTETEQLRATEVGCGTARAVMREWESSRECTLGDSSRSACLLKPFGCQAVRAGSNASVSCAGPSGDVSFIAKSWLAKKSAG